MIRATNRRIVDFLLDSSAMVLQRLLGKMNTRNGRVERDYLSTIQAESCARILRATLDCYLGQYLSA